MENDAGSAPTNAIDDMIAGFGTAEIVSSLIVIVMLLVVVTVGAAVALRARHKRRTGGYGNPADGGRGGYDNGED